jgi:RecA/RadA recombinase
MVKETVMKMGDQAIDEIESIPTGSLGLDVALGVGGYPRGRVVEIFGPESSGKNYADTSCYGRSTEARWNSRFL